jgi:hypothetical protein
MINISHWSKLIYSQILYMKHKNKHTLLFDHACDKHMMKKCRKKYTFLLLRFLCNLLLKTYVTGIRKCYKLDRTLSVRIRPCFQDSFILHRFIIIISTKENVTNSHKTISDKEENTRNLSHKFEKSCFFVFQFSPSLC